MLVFFSGLIVGIILFQSAVLAPTLFQTLEMKEAGTLLRAIFPKFFVLLACIGFILLLHMFLYQEGITIIHYGIAVMSIVFPLICKVIIPATNKARDGGNEAMFKRLHKVSVILTVSVLCANISIIFL